MSLIDDISAYTNPFGTPAKGKWNLTPGTWTPTTGKTVVFFAETRSGDPKGVTTAVDQISDTGARRLAAYEYPYVDGAKYKDMGRKAETYTFNIKFSGPNYQTKYKEFYDNVYKSNEIGTLSHPVLGAIRGTVPTRLQSFDPVHRHDESNSVTFRAVFVEDMGGKQGTAVAPVPSTETALQTALQNLVRTQAAISTALASATALLSVPSAITATINAQKNSLIGQISGLFGQLAATFSSQTDLLNTLSVASGAGGGVTGISSGIVLAGPSIASSKFALLPPVFQVALDAQSKALVEQNADAFVASNQTSPQKAVFSANQARAGISTAIAEIENSLGNYGYDIVVQYRQLSVSIQETVEACIASAQSKIKVYTVARPMSLRSIAFANGLSPDRQNDIESLNPYLGSVNLVPAGSKITVPVA